MAKKVSKKARCSNCGDETSLGNAVGERQSKGYCVPCYRQWSSMSINQRTGEEQWAGDNRSVFQGGTPAWLRPRENKSED